MFKEECCCPTGTDTAGTEESGGEMSHHESEQRPQLAGNRPYG